MTCQGDGDFAANLKVAGEKAGVDIGMFLIASDFHTKIQSIQEIGSSIIVLSSWTDFSDGSDEDLHNVS